MPSKELIALAANAMEERRKELIAQPLSRIYPQLAEAAAGAILATLQEPTEAVVDACGENWYYGGVLWKPMLAASALGEQAE